ncbi:amphi-Trp domain-containing protein [Nannocystaceae bacterium ST9]
MGKRSKIEHVCTLRREAIAELFDRIAAGLRSGSIELAVGGQRLRLEPDDLLELELEAKRKTERQSLALQLHWTTEAKLVIDGVSGRGGGEHGGEDEEHVREDEEHVREDEEHVREDEEHVVLAITESAADVPDSLGQLRLGAELLSSLTRSGCFAWRSCSGSRGARR